MHLYAANIKWSREGAPFCDNRYSRAHEWRFDGGIAVSASASPSIVPLPYSVEAAIDPEEALVASASSCHMLWFLSIAAKRGYVVDTYSDDAVGEMSEDADGKSAITRIILRPRISFSGEMIPTTDEVATLHKLAHQECFIANSLKSEIVVETG